MSDFTVRASLRSFLLPMAGALAISGCQHVQNVGKYTGGFVQPPASLGDVKAVSADQYCDEHMKHDMPVDNEYYLGRSAAANLMIRYGLSNTLPAEHPVSIYVRTVGQTLATVAEQHLGDASIERAKAEIPDRPRPMRGFQFIVVRSKAANAHGMPGGYIVVTTGLLEQVKDEEELAGVLAHEIAHVHRGHGVEIVERAMCVEANRDKTLEGKGVGVLTQTAASVDSLSKQMLSVDPKLQEKALAFYDSTVTGLFQKSLEKSLEFEADALGVQIATWAGYGASGLPNVLARLGSAQPQKTGLMADIAQLDSTHPPPNERLGKLRGFIATRKLPETVPAAEQRKKRFGAAFSGLASASDTVDEGGAGF